LHQQQQQHKECCTITELFGSFVVPHAIDATPAAGRSRTPKTSYTLILYGAGRRCRERGYCELRVVVPAACDLRSCPGGGDPAKSADGREERERKIPIEGKKKVD